MLPSNASSTPSPALGSPSNGGHAARQSPLQALMPSLSWVNMYSVMPVPSTTMSPTSELATPSMVASPGAESVVSPASVVSSAMSLLSSPAGAESVDWSPAPPLP